jgi:hypothetical protein
MIDGERRNLILFQISLYILGFPIILGIFWFITGSITIKNVIAPLVIYSILTPILFYEEYKRQY